MATDPLASLEREIASLLAVLERRGPDPSELELAAQRLRECSIERGGAPSDPAALARLATLHAVALDLARRAADCARRDLERAGAARRSLARRASLATGHCCDVDG
jgi:hypothetical protein